MVSRRLKFHHRRQSLGRVIAHHALDQPIKRRRLLHARVEGRKVPQVAQRTQHRRRRVRHGRSVRVRALLLHEALLHPRRDEERRQAAAQTVKLERVVLAAGRLGRVRETVGTDGHGRCDVVVEATGLVERDQQSGLVPLRAGADGLVDVFDERFAVGDEALRVHGGGADATAGRAEDGEMGQVACFGVAVEVGERLHEAGVATVIRPFEPERVLFRSVRDVVPPGLVLLRELLKHGHLGHGAIVEVIRTVTRGSAGVEGHTVRVGRLALLVSRRRLIGQA